MQKKKRNSGLFLLFGLLIVSALALCASSVFTRASVSGMKEKLSLFLEDYSKAACFPDSVAEADFDAYVSATFARLSDYCVLSDAPIVITELKESLYGQLHNPSARVFNAQKTILSMETVEIGRCSVRFSVKGEVRFQSADGAEITAPVNDVVSFRYDGGEWRVSHADISVPHPETGVYF